MSRAELKLVCRLVYAHAWQHPGRMLLTLISTIAAACVVVWVVSGYDSLHDKFGAFAQEYMGRYQLIALPIPPDGGQTPFRASAAVSPDLVEALRQDPAVLAVDPVFETRARIEKVRLPGEPVETATTKAAQSDDRARRNGAGRRAPASGEGSGSASESPGGEMSGEGIPNGGGVRYGGGISQLGSANRAPTLVGTNATQPPHTLLEGQWIDPSHSDRLEAAITRDSAEQLGIKVGSEVSISAGADREPVVVKVIGIVEQLKRLPPPKFMIGLPPSRAQALTRGPASAALYVPLALAEKISGRSAQITFAGIALKDDSQTQPFIAKWAERFATASPAIEAQSLEDVGDEVNNSTTFEGVRSQAYSATGISLLAALFIIFTTLSMGVHERIRQFAVLRAVSLTRSQIAAMIALESIVLGLIGWAGGLLAGWGLLKVVAHWRPELIKEGASLGTWCIALSGLCAVGGSLAASIMPAWKATRVSPLDAMAPRPRVGSARSIWQVTLAGVALIAVNPLVVFFVPVADSVRYGISAAVGCTCMAIGFVLLCPLTILLTEKICGPLVARLLGINPQLLATQLTTNMWRTLGTAVALTLGLGLFVAMQTWGHSMLGPYTPGPWTPDVVAVISPLGIPESQVDRVRHLPGIKPDQCTPLAFEQVKFVDDVTGAKIRSSSSRQDNCVIVGVDLDTAFGGKDPLFKFDFVEGTREQALEKMKSGRACLVPDHFQRESGLGVGSKFSIKLPDHPEQHLEYEIAGVVSMSGWHWMSKVGLRNHGGGRAAGLMFTSYSQVRSDYGQDRVSGFWMNVDGTQTDQQLQEALKKVAQENYDPELAQTRRRRRNNQAGDEAAAGAGLGVAAPGGAAPGGGFGRIASGANVNLRSAAGVREAIAERADGIIWVLCQLPLVTLAVTAIGVLNTVLSSIRARRWDMGVLRAVGVTRFALFRLIIAEVVLVGIVACLLSLGFGVMAGYCGTGVTRYINIRGGQITPLIVPWAQIGVGFAITIGLCLLAALWPAFSTGRTEPLRLLQAGRSAM